MLKMFGVTALIGFSALAGCLYTTDSLAFRIKMGNITKETMRYTCLSTGQNYYINVKQDARSDWEACDGQTWFQWDGRDTGWFKGFDTNNYKSDVRVKIHFDMFHNDKNGHYMPHWEKYCDIQFVYHPHSGSHYFFVSSDKKTCTRDYLFDNYKPYGSYVSNGDYVTVHIR